MGFHAQHWLLVGALVAGGPAAGQDCRIALSLAMDVSSSVDAEEYALQSGGLAAALRDPEVKAAFLAIPGQGVALHVFEWSARDQQAVVVDWVMVREAADLDAVANAVDASTRRFARHATAIGNAMVFGAEALASGPVCDAQVLDVSGDGETNDGIAPAQARQGALFDAITVNGLVIGLTRKILARHYEMFVIHGPGAFVEEAVDHADFSEAMRRKLIREVQPRAVSRLEAAPKTP